MIVRSFHRWKNGTRGPPLLGTFFDPLGIFFAGLLGEKKTRQVIKKVARTTPETGLNYSEKFNSLIISVTWYRFETFHATLHRLLPTTNFVSYLMIAPSLFCQWTWVPFPLLFIFPLCSSSLFHRRELERCRSECIEYDYL